VNDGADILGEGLRAVLSRHGIDGDVMGLRRLSGGANQETWAFDCGEGPFVLRRSIGGEPEEARSGSRMDLSGEARLMAAVSEYDVPVPRIHAVLEPEDGLGIGYIAERLAGETIPQRMFKNPDLAQVLPTLAGQCGALLARIHSVPADAVDGLASMPARPQLAHYRDLYDSYDTPRPVFEVAFRWLAERAPANAELTLVHGDFRNGNLLIDGSGVRAVLDWELAHLGNPVEDLGWICVNSWRFGRMDKRVGGFGDLDDLLAAYCEASGRMVSEAEVHYWEVFGSLKWGVMCMTMTDLYRRGVDRSVERAAIGRRVSESEIDLLRLTGGEAG
jgi:aminoglycoside phosphotransferase (APT) family kinase protein